MDANGLAKSIGASSREAFQALTDDMRRQAGRLAMAGTSENRKGVILALSSSIFIGASFIIKKKGLMIAGSTGQVRASAGGYSYLKQPLWWVGMGTMIGGEAANLAAYAYAPAIVVTPLGASTIIISAILANIFLGEVLHECGILASCLAILGSVVLLSHAPAEAPLESVEQIWGLATQPVFLAYATCVIAAAVFLMYRFAPRYGRTHLLIYVLICSLIGSLSVVSCKVRWRLHVHVRVHVHARGAVALCSGGTPSCVRWCELALSRSTDVSHLTPTPRVVASGARHRAEANDARQQPAVQEGNVCLHLLRGRLCGHTDELPQQGALLLATLRRLCAARPPSFAFARLPHARSSRL